MTQSICRELEKRTVVHTMLSKFMHKSTSSLKLLNKKYDWYGSYSGTILCTATTVASIYVLMPPKLKIFSRRQTMSVSTAQGQKITRQKKQSFLISFTREATSSVPKLHVDKPGTSDNHCADRPVFWCSGQEISLLFAFTSVWKPHVMGQAEENT